MSPVGAGLRGCPGAQPRFPFLCERPRNRTVRAISCPRSNMIALSSIGAWTSNSLPPMRTKGCHLLVYVQNWPEKFRRSERVQVGRRLFRRSAPCCRKRRIKSSSASLISADTSIRGKLWSVAFVRFAPAATPNFLPSCQKCSSNQSQIKESMMLGIHSLISESIGRI